MRRRVTGPCHGPRRRSVVVQAHAAGKVGLGYTYADISTATLIDQQARRRREGTARPIAPRVVGGNGEGDPQPVAGGRPRWRSPPSISPCGICTRAWWSFRCACCSVWPMIPRTRIPRPRRVHQLHRRSACEEQLAGWATQGFRRVKMKIGARARRQTAARVRAAREAIGPASPCSSTRMAPISASRHSPLAGAVPRRRCSWFEEPVSAPTTFDGLRLLRDRAPAGMAIAAGEYGYDAWYFRRMLERRRRRRAAG